MKRQFILAVAALALFGALPAQACMSRTLSHHLLDEVPDNTPAGASVIRVHFTNRNPARWQREMPIRTGQGRIFVGIARRLDGQPASAFPVYASASSCEPDFMPSPRPLDREALLVGRFVALGGQQVFVVLARDADGSWESFEGERP
jgi:hypothetical protein